MGEKVAGRAVLNGRARTPAEPPRIFRRGSETGRDGPRRRLPPKRDAGSADRPRRGSRSRIPSAPPPAAAPLRSTSGRCGETERETSPATMAALDLPEPGAGSDPSGPVGRSPARRNGCRRCRYGTFGIRIGAGWTLQAEDLPTMPPGRLPRIAAGCRRPAGTDAVVGVWRLGHRLVVAAWPRRDAGRRRSVQGGRRPTREHGRTSYSLPEGECLAAKPSGTGKDGMVGSFSPAGAAAETGRKAASKLWRGGTAANSGYVHCFGMTEQGCRSWKESVNVIGKMLTGKRFSG